MNPEMDAAVTSCGNCHAPMPKELRFCRNCGFRLGEGSAEYTETVRFQNAPPGTIPGPGAPNAFPYGHAGGAMTAAPRGPIKKRCRRMSGMSWIFIGLLFFFIAAAGFTNIVKRVRPGLPGRPAVVAAQISKIGIEELDTTEGGVTFDHVWPAGSPADKAGLVGGDIITTVDGQRVESDDDLLDLLRRTPIGKTIDVVYLRDGETKTAKLTTLSGAELDQLATQFDKRPEGKGRFGYREGSSERVEIPGTKMFGVRLDRVDASLPADMAGIKVGDVVIEFAGVPIRTSEELAARVMRAKPYETVDVVVLRGGERQVIPVKMGKQE
ncbi:MAG: serine protease Do [Pyrinomonadaceae bacterium]|nr:serine protease Do [Pyrinomonadaceae bacterium]